MSADVPRDRYELHCHLDGSVRLATIAEMASEAGLRLSEPVRELAVAPPGTGSLHAFLPYIDVALDVLQTPAALERAAAELVEDWQRDRVAYGEVRFAPQLHGRNGMSVADAIAAVDRGLRSAGREHSVATGLIVCCLRHEPLERSMRVADAAARHRGIVVGLDLAGDERIPGAAHAPAFDIAHQAGLPVTVHAGEAAGPESVWEAIDVLGARRIGHGVRSVADKALVRRLAADRIALETCPRCNVLTGAVASLSAHPAQRLLDLGVAVTISTDTRTTAGTNLDAEFRAMEEVFGWPGDTHAAVQENARRAAFAARLDL